MGGLFAQTSGLPLKLSIQGNEMAYQDSFFPQLSTLGDVLNEAGYKQYFMMGSGRITSLRTVIMKLTITTGRSARD